MFHTSTARRTTSMATVVLLCVATIGAAVAAQVWAPSTEPAARQIARVEDAVAAHIIDEGVLDDLRARGETRAIVHLDTTAALGRIVAGAGRSGSPAAVNAIRDAVAAEKKSVFDHLGRDASLARDFEFLGAGVVVFRSEAALLRLARMGAVSRIAANGEQEPALEQSLKLINQPVVAAAGHRGQGIYVGVLDTGVDAARYPTYFPAGSIAGTREIADEDNSPDDVGHGTHVSSTVLAVAPGAKLFVADVFHITGYTLFGEPIHRASDEDIAAGVTWLLSLKAQGFDIRAINLSLGSGHYSGSCDDGYHFYEAYVAGIIPVVAAGNSAFEDEDGNATTTFQPGLGAPACSKYALSVGATTDDVFAGSDMCDPSDGPDRVADFSQAVKTADFTGPAMLAPGTCIVAAGGEMQGTSMASPHVAGAVAVLASADPAASAAQIRAALTSNGPVVTDSRTGLSLHRLDLAAALAALTGDTSNPGTITSDHTGPIVSTPVVSLTAGSAVDSDGRLFATVVWSATDPSGVSRFIAKFSDNGGAWTDVTLPSATQTSATFWLAAGHQFRVIVAAQDGAGNWSGWSISTMLTAQRYAETDSAATLSDAWVSMPWASAQDGSLSVSDTPGSSACFRFNASSVAWIATKASNRGTATVSLDGQALDTVDLQSAQLQAKSLVWTRDVTAGVTHTLCIETTGTAGRPDVDIDGFALLY